MRNLNRDEKKYINDKIKERAKILLEKYDKEDLKELVKKDILSNTSVKNAIKFLETILPKDSVSERSFNYGTTNGSFEFWNGNISIKITVKLSPVVVDKLNEFDKISNMLCNINYNPYGLNFEKYYILFSTWVAPNTERLNKINELIELIYKDLIA